MNYIPLTEEQVKQAEGYLEALAEEKLVWERRKEISKKLAKFTSDPDFKDVFIDFYCKEELQRKVGLLTEKSFSTHDGRQELQDDIVGVAVFRDWLSGMSNMEELASTQLTTIESQIEANEGYIRDGIPDTPVETEE